jgi:hypothetical protein
LGSLSLQVCIDTFKPTFHASGGWQVEMLKLSTPQHKGQGTTADIAHIAKDGGGWE